MPTLMRKAMTQNFGDLKGVKTKPFESYLKPF
jgi:hypothetical protein